MTNVYHHFRTEIMDLVIKPKFQMLAAQGNFINQKDFFNKFREQHGCKTSDATLKKWMKELGYELVDCTEMVLKHPHTNNSISQPQALPVGEDGFDNEAQTDWVGGIINGSGIGSRQNH